MFKLHLLNKSSFRISVLMTVIILSAILIVLNRIEIPKIYESNASINHVSQFKDHFLITLSSSAFLDKQYLKEGYKVMILLKDSVDKNFKSVNGKIAKSSSIKQAGQEGIYFDVVVIDNIDFDNRLFKINNGEIVTCFVYQGYSSIGRLLFKNKSFKSN